MTNHTTNDNEHIRGAVELIGAKARRRLARLQQRVENGGEGLAPEIEELERIERLSASAWEDLNKSTPA